MQNISKNFISSLLVGSFLIAISTEARSSTGIAFASGNSLHEMCRSNEPLEQSYCASYIIGAADMLEGFESLKHVRNRVCFPNGVKSQQIVDVVKKYLQGNPSERHLQGSVIVMDALIASFECAD